MCHVEATCCRPLALAETARFSAITDVCGVRELGHVGDQCSFDAFLRKYDLRDPALQDLAPIVRGADTSRLDLTPQSAGLHAISVGLSKNYPDDHEMLEHGMVLYESLYAWCKARVRRSRNNESSTEDITCK